MVRLKHPTNRQERLKIKQKKDTFEKKEKSNLRRRVREEIKDKETADELNAYAKSTLIH